MLSNNKPNHHLPLKTAMVFDFGTPDTQSLNYKSSKIFNYLSIIATASVV
jgi:hypothetical protein